MPNPNCYECKFRGNNPGDHHSRCNHPTVSGSNWLLAMAGMIPDAIKVTASPHGIRSGWLSWPMNFDPVWLQSCTGFIPKETKQ